MTGTVRIALSPAADELQNFAAAELKQYLKKLFDVEAALEYGPPQGKGAAILLGRTDAPHLRQVCPSLPDLSDQGHLLRRIGEETLVLAGGSSAAVAWAVYELAERWGVRFLLHGDLLPQDPGPFHLPEVDLVLEPLLRLRSWRQFNDLATGPVLWSLEQQERFIRQIFKLKYNGIYLCLWPQHPFVDYEVQGIRRRTTTFLFGQKIPIGPDNIGREHLPDLPFLDHPEIGRAAGFEEKLEAGRRHLHGILDLAQFYQMHTSIQIQPLEFPNEFRSLLERPTEEQVQLGGLTCAEQGDLTHPNHIALIEANLRAHLEQWGRVDEFHLGLPEHPHADQRFRECWKELDERYGLEKAYPLDEMLEKARTNHLIPGGLERAEREFKSAVSMLHFFERFFAGNDLLDQARARGISLSLTLGGNSELLLPVVERILWEGGGINTSMGYTASRAVRVMDGMERLDAARVPARLILTLQDDNVGSLPQVATHSLHLLVRQMQQLGWQGFFTRHWPIGDLDPPAAYLARASWNADETPASAYHHLFSRLYGREASDGMIQVMQLLEDATLILDLDFLSLFFPVLDIMTSYMEADAPMPEGLFHVRALYEQARRLLDQAKGRTTAEAGRADLAYWRSRLDFSIQALIEKEQLHQAGMQLHAARRATDEEEKERRLAAARSLYEQAVAEGEKGLRAMAAQVRDESDQNSLAAYYHFFVRQVRQRAARGIRSPETCPD